MKHHITVAAVGLAVAGALFAQRDVQTFRATMTGGGGDRGKCTIEVVVDGTAEVQVAGDSGRLVTLGGQPSSWRRMQCNGPIPRNPSDFRFRGIDGRGQVSLAQDPRSNRGIAVVRIDDPKGGSEGYTFDLEWTGGSNNGQGNNGRFGNDRRNDRNGGWNDRNDRNDRWSD
ncbi:MAG: hypothetical protein H7Y20_12865, partial [Bryobacteraceae bacterium]|nr:hypothetical protein [Bryobacteraceae bacterium]